MEISKDRIPTWAIALIVNLLIGFLFHLDSQQNNRMNNIDGRIDAVILNAFDKP